VPRLWDAGASVSGAGFWAVGGFPTDGTSVFAVSGNAIDRGDGGNSALANWVGGEGVFRLGPSLTFSGLSRDYFYPSDWLHYDVADQDLGGASPVLFKMGGSTYLLTVDKEGIVYVLDPANLGGSGEALLTYSLNCASDCDVVGAPIVYTTAEGAYVGIPEGSREETEILYLSGNPPQVTPRPDAGVASRIVTLLAAPIATTPDGSSEFVVWTVSGPHFFADGGTLSAVDGFTGRMLATVPTPDSVHSFNPPIAANGRIVAAGCGACFGPPGELTAPPAGDGQLMFFY
jgi:hypothetical protein